MTCWQKYGSPAILNDAVRDAAQAVADVYEWSVVGGALHVVLDDWNIEDEHLSRCAQGIEDPSRVESEEQLVKERYCLALFRKLSLEERASVLAFAEGYISP